jgi:nitrite reductase/ring-hydroxylating ferredoxin subunit
VAEVTDRTSREARGAPPRRQFFERFLELFAAGYFSVILYPLYRYLRSGPKLVETVEVTAVKVGKLVDVPPNSAKMFKFGGTPGILVRTAAGELHAFNAICSHLRCTVQYRSDWERIWCACHGSRFDTVNGTPQGGPAPGPLKQWKVEVANGEIFVSRA